MLPRSPTGRLEGDLHSLVWLASRCVRTLTAAIHQHDQRLGLRIPNGLNRDLCAHLHTSFPNLSKKTDAYSRKQSGCGNVETAS
jgi:hypothetical protein